METRGSDQSVEVRYDHFSNQCFRHGRTFLRVRPDKLPKDCLLEQVVEHATIQDTSAFIETGLATVGANIVNVGEGRMEDEI